MQGNEDDISDQIIYRGEGNSSIVIALKTRAKVIRLLKKDGKIMKSSQYHHAAQHPMRSMKFIHLIMKPLAAPFLSGAMELIHLKSDFINLLSKEVEVYRPFHRLDKTLHLDDQYALVMDDLCALPSQLTEQIHPEDLCGPTISVEIKPKQGFLPIHRSVMKSSTNDRLANRMKNSCLYGSTQYLKLARGRIRETSNYCPINLFSGCPIKMRIALEELINNPQNNLRIFKDLVLAYDECNQLKLSNIFEDFFHETAMTSSRLHHHKIPSSSEDRLIELLIQCLLNDHDNRDTELVSSLGDNENSFNNSGGCLLHALQGKCRRCDTHPTIKKHKSDTSTTKIHKLPDSCVLSSVLRAQKLDTIGAHEALQMLEWLIENAKTNGNIDILEELSKPQIPPGFGTPYQLPYESKHQYYFRKVWEFLVSLTAKDCSIIITIRRISPRGYERISNNRPQLRNHLLKEHRSGHYYLFNVGIADLDQKMPLKILKICDNLNLMLQTGRDYVKKELSNSNLQTSPKILVGPS